MILSQLEQPEDVQSCRLVCRPWCNAIDSLFEMNDHLSIEDECWTRMGLQLNVPNVGPFGDFCRQFNATLHPRRPRIFSRKLVMKVEETQVGPLTILEEPDVASVLRQIKHLEFQHGVGEDYDVDAGRQLAINSAPSFYKSVLDKMENLKELTVDVITDNMCAGFVSCKGIFCRLERIAIQSKVDNRDVLNDHLLLLYAGNQLRYYSSPAFFRTDKCSFLLNYFMTLEELSLPNASGTEVLEYLKQMPVVTIKKLALPCLGSIEDFVSKLHEFSLTHAGLLYAQIRIVANQSLVSHADYVMAKALSYTTSSQLKSLEILCHNVAGFEHLKILKSVEKIVLCCFGNDYSHLMLIQQQTSSLGNTDEDDDSSSHNKTTLLAFLGYEKNPKQKTVWELLPSLQKLELKVYESSLCFDRSKSKLINHVFLTRAMFNVYF